MKSTVSSKHKKHIKVEPEQDKEERKSKKPKSFKEFEETKSLNLGQMSKVKDTKEVREKDHEKAPENWRKMWNLIVEMRKNKTAPVDTMGASQQGEKKRDLNTYAYQTLIGVMLSAQSMDAVTSRVMGKLKKYGLTIEKINDTPEEDLFELIKEINFNRTKASRIKVSTRMIVEEFGGKVPSTLKDLIKLKGVGQKMAQILLQEAFDKVEGIAVDVHVHRIAERLGWTSKPANPNDSMKQLMEWLPKDKWTEINVMLVGFGQERCTALHPQCSTCLVKDLCPFGIKHLTQKSRKTSTRKKSSFDQKFDQLDLSLGKKTRSKRSKKAISLEYSSGESYVLSQEDDEDYDPNDKRII